VLVDDELHYAESLTRFLRGTSWAASPITGRSGIRSRPTFATLIGDAETALRLLSVFAGAPAWRRPFWSPAVSGRNLGTLHGTPRSAPPDADRVFGPGDDRILVHVAPAPVSLLLSGGAGGGLRGSTWLTGATLGLAWLTRQEAQFVLVILIVVGLLSGGGQGARRTLGRRIRMVALMSVLFVLVASPYVVLLHAKTGRWTVGSKAAVNLSSPVLWQEGLEKEKYLYSLNAEGTRRALEDETSDNPLRAIWQNRRSIATRYAQNLNAGLGVFRRSSRCPYFSCWSRWA